MAEFGQRSYAKPKRIINQPEVSDFKGNSVLSIPFGRESEAWSFGYMKAKAIQKYSVEINQFILECEKKFSGGNPT